MSYIRINYIANTASFIQFYFFIYRKWHLSIAIQDGLQANSTKLLALDLISRNKIAPLKVPLLTLVESRRVQHFAKRIKHRFLHNLEIAFKAFLAIIRN